MKSFNDITFGGISVREFDLMIFQCFMMKLLRGPGGGGKGFEILKGLVSSVIILYVGFGGFGDLRGFGSFRVFMGILGLLEISWISWPCY